MLHSCVLLLLELRLEIKSYLWPHHASCLQGSVQFCKFLFVGFSSTLCLVTDGFTPTKALESKEVMSAGALLAHCGLRFESFGRHFFISTRPARFHDL